MLNLMSNYVIILYYAALSIILSLIIYIASYILSPDGENLVDKTTPYECGFEAFGDARDSFDIKYYLLGIIFLIFDLELIFLLPWVVCLSKLNIISVFSILTFLIVLTTGFIFEWKKGSLDW
jgi:NADH-quinone oxidoreductase subunit A